MDLDDVIRRLRELQEPHGESIDRPCSTVGLFPQPSANKPVLVDMVWAIDSSGVLLFGRLVGIIQKFLYDEISTSYEVDSTAGFFTVERVELDGCKLIRELESRGEK